MSPARRERKKAVRPADSLVLAKAAAAAALESKASNPVVLHIGQVVNYADYFVIVSGTSSRQVQSIAENVEAKLRALGVTLLGTEGLREGAWVLIDAGDVVVHVFHQPARDFYEIEKLWADAPWIELDPPEPPS